MLQNVHIRSCQKVLLRLAALACTFVALQLVAQSKQGSGTNRATAVMQVRINVAPVVLAPAARHSAQAASPITYNVPTRPVRLTIREELRPLVPGDGVPSSAGALVRVRTVVAD